MSPLDMSNTVPPVTARHNSHETLVLHFRTLQSSANHPPPLQLVDVCFVRVQFSSTPSLRRESINTQSLACRIFHNKSAVVGCCRCRWKLDGHPAWGWNGWLVASLLVAARLGETEPTTHPPPLTNCRVAKSYCLASAFKLNQTVGRVEVGKGPPIACHFVIGYTCAWQDVIKSQYRARCFINCVQFPRRRPSAVQGPAP